MFFLDCYDLSKKGTKKQRKNVDYDNKLLQLGYSLENLQTLRELKERNNKIYQSDLNNKKLQKKLQEWRRSKQR
ncbi:hypothetical protein HpBT059_11090 [Helicobacter pylori]